MKTLTAKKVNGKWEIEAEKLESALLESEGKARERKLTVEDVNKAINTLDKDLKSKGICRKNLNGVWATINPNRQDFPSCYNGIPASTFIRVQYGKSGSPAITDIYRTRCGNEWANVHFTEAASLDIVMTAGVMK